MIDADPRRYGSFSDFLYTIFVFGLGVLFSIFVGVRDGRSNADLKDLISKIQGQKGKYEKARQRYLSLQSWLYRIKAGEKLYYTFAIVLGICMYKSKDLYSFIITERGTFLLPLFVASIVTIRIAIGFYE